MQRHSQQSPTASNEKDIEHNLQQYHDMQSVKLIKKHLDEAMMMLNGYRKGLYDSKQDDEVRDIFKKIELHIEMANYSRNNLLRSLPGTSQLLVALSHDIANTQQLLYSINLNYKISCEMRLKQKAGASFIVSKL
jgi:hypothetical protein